MNPEQLRTAVASFLEALQAKPDEDRTAFEQLLLETGNAFASKLSRYCAKHSDKAVSNIDRSVLGLLTNYNDINREYDLRDADLQVAETLRKGRR